MSVEFHNGKCGFLPSLTGLFGFSQDKVTQVLWQHQPICKLRIISFKNLLILTFGFDWDFW